MRTLIVHNGALGDFILACPAIAGIAAEGEVVLAGIRERVGLGVAAGIAASAVDLDAIGFSSAFSTPNERLRDFLKDFDRAIVWLEDGEGRIARAFTQCGVGEVYCFPGLPGPAYRKPAWNYYVESLGLSNGKPPTLSIGPAGEALGVVMHPGSGGRKKCWAMDNFDALAQQLAESGHQTVISSGPAEHEWKFPASLRRLPEMKLTALASALAGAKLYIGNDSGVTHLAAAVGCPTVAIFGFTDPRIWAPTGPKVRILGHLAHWPTVDQVFEAAQGLLGAD